MPDQGALRGSRKDLYSNIVPIRITLPCDPKRGSSPAKAGKPGTTVQKNGEDHGHRSTGAAFPVNSSGVKNRRGSAEGLELRFRFRDTLVEPFELLRVLVSSLRLGLQPVHESLLAQPCQLPDLLNPLSLLRRIVPKYQECASRFWNQEQPS